MNEEFKKSSKGNKNSAIKRFHIKQKIVY